MLKGKTSSITYDQAGQTTSKDGTEQFGWDPWGNLIAIQTPNYTWKASYDALGRRLQTTYTQKGILWNTSLKTTSLFDPEHEFQEIGVKYNNKTFWKLYGPTSCDALIDNDGNTLALLQDALSNLKAIVSQDHTHWIEELPSPYGPTGPPLTLEPDLLTYAKSLTWQDNKLDPTGLIHLGARYYDPKTGRFLSPDPISYPTCLDLYTYANNDPVNFRDPSGRFASTAYDALNVCVIGTGNILDFTAQQIGGADMSYYERTRSLAAFQNNPSIGLDPFSNVRFQGGMRALVGFAEGGIGAGLYMTPTFGVGQFVGSMMMAHGYDNFQSGARQAYRGSYQEPATIPILQSFGLSHKNAQIGHEFITTMGIVVGGLQVSINSANANAASRLPPRNPGVEQFSKSVQDSMRNNPLNGTQYTTKVVNQMRLNAQTATPDFHGFPKIVDNYAGLGRQEIIVGGDGVARIKISLPGGYQGREGFFEWIIGSDKKVNHRLFVPNYKSSG